MLGGPGSSVFAAIAMRLKNLRVPIDSAAHRDNFMAVCTMDAAWPDL
jgi:hypothetical protein